VSGPPPPAPLELDAVAAPAVALVVVSVVVASAHRRRPRRPVPEALLSRTRSPNRPTGWPVARSAIQASRRRPRGRKVVFMFTLAFMRRSSASLGVTHSPVCPPAPKGRRARRCGVVMASGGSPWLVATEGPSERGRWVAQGKCASMVTGGTKRGLQGEVKTRAPNSRVVTAPPAHRAPSLSVCRERTAQQGEANSALRIRVRDSLRGVLDDAAGQSAGSRNRNPEGLTVATRAEREEEAEKDAHPRLGPRRRLEAPHPIIPSPFRRGDTRWTVRAISS
jgi:hypothetical protein